jgi:DNA-directed RNA polymerase specialized sigma subunit
MYDPSGGRLKPPGRRVDALGVPMTVLTPHPPTLSQATPSAVWSEYRRTGDVRLRDRLLFTLAPLVRHAGADGPADAEAGLAALMDAIEAFAPDRDGGLERYAWSRVRAALASRA